MEENLNFPWSRTTLYLLDMYRTQDLHVKEIVPLLSPRALKAQLPTTDEANATVARSRERVIRILRQEDPRLLVVIGPCSIHDEKSALEYADRLNALRKQFADRMEIIMRVYFEKPRTTIGWKGLINDPHLDGSQDIGTGLKIARTCCSKSPAWVCRRPRNFWTRLFRNTPRTSLPGRRSAQHHGIANTSRNGERTFHARWLEKQHRRQFTGGH